MKKLIISLLLPLVMLGQQNRPQPTEADLARMAKAVPTTVQAKVTRPRNVLVYCDAMGFYHTSIPYATASLKILGEKTGAFKVTCVSEDPSVFEPENLKQFDVIFLNNNTSRKPFGKVHFEKMKPGSPERIKAEAREARLRKSFLDFVRKEGKGIVGIHAATDAMYDWPEYGEMLGGFFDLHPWSEKVGVELCESGHPLMRGWRGAPFYINEEIYQQKAPYSRDKQRVLMRLDVARVNMSKKGIKRTDGDFALGWIKPYGKGRVAYIAFGHRHETFWDKRMLTMLLDCIQYAAGDLKVDDRPSNQVSAAEIAASNKRGFAEGMKALAADLAQYQHAVDDAVAWQIDDLANRLEDPKEAEKAAVLAAELARLLVPSSSVDCRNFVLRQLSRLGGDAEVAAVATQLGDEKTSDMALYCLQRLPGAKADDALIAGLEHKRLRGAISSILGQRRCGKAVSALAGLLGEDETTASQAALALGKICTADAADALVKAFGSSKGALRFSIGVALSDIAQGLDDVAAARRACEALAASDASGNVRASAIGRLVVLDGAQGIERGIEAMKSGDVSICAAVAEALLKVENGDGLALVLSKPEGELPAVAVHQALRVAGEKGGSSFEVLVLKAVESKDVATSIEAIKALELIGSGISVVPLARVTDKERADWAMRSLTRMRGKGVTDMMVAESTNKEHDATARASMIKTLGLRKEGTAPFYATLILNGEPAVRRAALSSLELVATWKDAEQLKDLIAGVKSASDRSKLVRIAVASGRRGEDLAGFSAVFLRGLSAASDGKLRTAYINVLGNVAHESALPALTKALEDGDGDVKRAAILVLSNWPTDAPLQAIRAVSIDDKATEAHRVLALRGYAQLLGLPSTRPIRETLSMYKEALAVTKSPMEKRTLVGGLGNLVHPDAFALARTFMDVPDLANEALLASAKIWEGMNGAKMSFKASHGGAFENAIDGNLKTRWTSGKHMSGNEWFEIDMGYEGSINEIYLNAGEVGNDYPREYRIFVSSDRTKWGKPVLTGKGTDRKMRLKLDGYGRYIRIEQLGSANMFWSICEMSINGFPGGRGTLIPAKDLKFTSNKGVGSLRLMVDGNRNTRWATNAPQQTGDWLMIELPRVCDVKRIMMDARLSNKDYPRGYRVDVSMDGKTWKGPYALGAGRGASTEALPLPNKCKFVKITLTAGDPTYYWSIHEMSIFAE